jgi:hypothetical protein
MSKAGKPSFSTTIPVVLRALAPRTTVAGLLIRLDKVPIHRMH